MRFYKHTHAFYAGVDLHARSMLASFVPPGINLLSFYRDYNLGANPKCD